MTSLPVVGDPRQIDYAVREIGVHYIEPGRRLCGE